MSSVRKGADAERELVRILTEAGHVAHRNPQRGFGGLLNPDVQAEGLEGFHLEVKRVEALDLSSAMIQASHDAAGKRTPIVAHRKNRTGWMVTMYLDDFLTLAAPAKPSPEPLEPFF